MLWSEEVWQGWQGNEGADTFHRPPTSLSCAATHPPLMLESYLGPTAVGLVGIIWRPVKAVICSSTNHHCIQIFLFFVHDQWSKSIGGLWWLQEGENVRMSTEKVENSNENELWLPVAVVIILEEEVWTVRLPCKEEVLSSVSFTLWRRVTRCEGAC